MISTICGWIILQKPQDRAVKIVWFWVRCTIVINTCLFICLFFVCLFVICLLACLFICLLACLFVFCLVSLFILFILCLFVPLLLWFFIILSVCYCDCSFAIDYCDWFICLFVPLILSLFSQFVIYIGLCWLFACLSVLYTVLVFHIFFVF